MQPSSKLLATAWLATASFPRLGQAQTTTSATATSAAITSTTSTTSTRVPEAFEIDVIYPRNETYNATETFPVVVAIQKPLVASRLGKFSFGAYIMPYSNWDTPGGIDVGNTDNWIRPYDAANFTDDPFFLIEVTDATRWNQGVSYSGRGLHALIWTLSWDQRLDDCGSDQYFSGRIFFTIDDEGVNPNILDADECPFEGSVVQVNSNEGACPAIRRFGNRGTGDPCAIKIDSAKASSISSQIASLATPAPAATITATTKDDKDSSAGSLGISIVLTQAAVLVSASLLWM